MVLFKMSQNVSREKIAPGHLHASVISHGGINVLPTKNPVRKELMS